MVNAMIDIPRIERELHVRRWTRMDLHERMQWIGWQGSWRSLYAALAGEVPNPALHIVEAISRALDLPITACYIPSHPDDRGQRAAGPRAHSERDDRAALERARPRREG